MHCFTPSHRFWPSPRSLASPRLCSPMELSARGLFLGVMLVVVCVLAYAVLCVICLVRRSPRLRRIIALSQIKDFKSSLRSSPPISPEGSESSGSCDLASCKTHLLAEPISRMRHSRDSRNSAGEILDAFTDYGACGKMPPPSTEGRILLRVLSEGPRDEQTDIIADFLGERADHVLNEGTFDPARIGTVTRHGLRPAKIPHWRRAIGGGATTTAKINQDRGLVCWPFRGSVEEALLCIFDGHGTKGERVSEFAMHRLPAKLQVALESPHADPAAVLTQVVSELDAELLAHPEIGSMAMCTYSSLELQPSSKPHPSFASATRPPPLP